MTSVVLGWDSCICKRLKLNFFFVQKDTFQPVDFEFIEYIAYSDYYAQYGANTRATRCELPVGRSVLVFSHSNNVSTKIQAIFSKVDSNQSSMSTPCQHRRKKGSCPYLPVENNKDSVTIN